MGTRSNNQILFFRPFMSIYLILFNSCELNKFLLKVVKVYVK